MAKADLTWTNNSVGLNAEGTRVERVTNGSFSTVNPEVVATGNADGLNPELATGYYTDESVEGGNSYQYRVVTYGGGDEAISFPSASEYVPDVISDIGYPGGEPALTNDYNLAQAPVFHFDPSRASYSLRPNIDFLDAPVLSESVATAIPRYTTLGELRLTPPVNVYNDYIDGEGYIIQKSVDENNSKYVPALYANKHYPWRTGMNVEYPDEVTYCVAYAGSGSATPGLLVGRNKTLSDKRYTYILRNNTTMGQLAPKPWATRNELHIVTVRVLNTSAAANSSGGSKVQLFHNGLMYVERTFDSYHTHGNQGYGAFSAHDYFYWGAYSGTNGVSNFEAFLFNKALSVDDLNVLHSYLGDKLNKTVNILSPDDVYTV